MTTGPTPRQRARDETLRRIKELALVQLAESGASELSLRSIARDLNLVSSAIYRYYASRDDLLTALIVEAYGDLADRLAAASEPDRRGQRRRFLDTAAAMREWALAAPHRWALIYGSAIPGYRAPTDTVDPAGRVVAAFAAACAGASSPSTSAVIGRRLRADLDRLDGVLDGVAGAETLLRLVGAFARVVGLLNLELNGHFVGGFEPADDLYAALLEREADALGL